MDDEFHNQEDKGYPYTTDESEKPTLLLSWLAAKSFNKYKGSFEQYMKEANEAKKHDAMVLERDGPREKIWDGWVESFKSKEK